MASARQHTDPQALVLLTTTAQYTTLRVGGNTRCKRTATQNQRAIPMHCPTSRSGNTYVAFASRVTADASSMTMATATAQVGTGRAASLAAYLMAIQSARSPRKP